jgi:hypothetical protein
VKESFDLPLILSETVKNWGFEREIWVKNGGFSEEVERGRV